MTATQAAAARTAKQMPYVSLLLGAAAVAVYAQPLLPSALDYTRETLAAGQWWRILTCHWTHWSAGHLFWDVVMFITLGAVCERFSRVRTSIAVLAAAAIIPMVLHACSPGMTGYRGLSGLDSALFALAGVMIARQSLAYGDRGRAVLTILCLAAFPAKIVFEWLTGTAFFVHDDSGMVPVPLAHVVGGAVGAMAGCVRYWDGDRDITAIGVIS